MQLTDAKRIRACFVSGCVCCALAFWLAPQYMTLAALAGISAGYISHDVRRFLRSVPEALSYAMQQSRLAKLRAGFAECWEMLIDAVNEYLSKPHPFVYEAAIPIVLLVMSWTYVAYSTLTPDPKSGILGAAIMTFVVTAGFGMYLGGIVAAAFVLIPLMGIALLGARQEHSFWTPFFGGSGQEEITRKKLLTKGLKEAPLTFGNVLRWQMLGLLVIGKLMLFGILMMPLRSIGWCACFVAHFIVRLLTLYHRHEALVCGIDGTAGGLIARLLLGAGAETTAEMAVVTICGGLIGVAVGELDFEIVSKRWLKLAPRRI